MEKMQVGGLDLARNCTDTKGGIRCRDVSRKVLHVALPALGDLVGVLNPGSLCRRGYTTF